NADALNEEKLAAICRLWTKDLEQIAAWPRGVLYDAKTRVACGLLMAKVDKARPLHELYGTSNRRRHFPDAAWHHLLLAARNVAAAFHTLHERGVVVGDVNQGNLLVDGRMCVHLIDCDSFQITEDAKVFGSPVGTPHFTPPELQGIQLREVRRTVDHDGFGLAVLVFHLLFLGRHPFAGRYRRSGEMPIERAIAERRFAFSRQKDATQVDPPTASLLLEDLPSSLADLFERAFRAESADGARRPRPEEWVQQLEALMKQREICSYDAAHIFYRDLPHCPWCRIEDEGGPSFFVAGGGATVVTKNRLADLDARIKRLPALKYVDLPPGRVAPPQAARFKKLDKLSPWSRLDTAAWGVALSAATGLAAFKWPWTMPCSWAGLAAAAGYLWRGPAACERRTKLAELTGKLESAGAKVQKAGATIAARHCRRAKGFHAALGELKTELAHYLAEGEELRKVLVRASDAHRNEFLRGHLIRDHVSEIAGLTISHVGMLESFGIETAGDVDRIKLYGVPGVDAELELEFGRWLQQINRNFVFRPDHGVTAGALDAAEELATQRYKLSQARKVLTGAKHVEGLADAGAAALTGELAAFDKLGEAWREAARELRELESKRRPLERTINRSHRVLAGVVAAAAVLGLLSWAMG
ncbi:MAG: hypothetical protein KDA61_05830, partial [Planctomycetales bacterium]|nr:hypothetical protein [Planctomycetales bacterium]